MNLKSIAYQTDLIFPKFEGKVTDRGKYIVIETPDNLDYVWGNMLVFPQAPTTGDFPGWMELFKKEFQNNPKIRHVTLGWDGTETTTGVSDPFLKAGFQIEHAIVLTAPGVTRPPKFDREIQVRPLKGDADWDDALTIQLMCRDPEYP